MILVNSQPATLIKHNRNKEENYFDDEDISESTIRVVPYNADEAVKFGIATYPEATGYFVTSRLADVREGDQLQFIGKFKNTNIDLTDRTFTILKVEDRWLFNRIEDKLLIVK